jgi:hypothetical protein
MARVRVTVARELAAVLHRMWRDNTEFRFGRAPDAVQRLATVRGKPNSFASRESQIVPVGTKGKVISSRVRSLSGKRPQGRETD